MLLLGQRPQVGENFWEIGRSTVDTRGDATDSGTDLDDADHKGYLAAEYILNANKYMMDSGDKLIWEQNRQRALERAAVWMRHYRNHPSVVMWIAGMNFFNSAVDADPRHLGRRGWDQTNQRWQRLLAAGKEMFDGLKKLDPTRAYYSHAGAYTGDVYTMNCYLDLIPLQEREDWLSEWAQSGEMPISMVEFGTPMDCTFRRGRHGFHQQHHQRAPADRIQRHLLWQGRLCFRGAQVPAVSSRPVPQRDALQQLREPPG